MGVNTTMRRQLLTALLALSLGMPVFAAPANNKDDKSSDSRKEWRKKHNLRDRDPEKIDKALAGALRCGKSQKVIITMKPGAATRTNMRKSLESKGRKVRREYAKLNLLVSELSASEVLDLANNDDVQAVSLDGPVGAAEIL